MDTDTATDAAEAQTAGVTFKIKIPKAGQSIEVVWADLPQKVQMYIVEQGLSKLLVAATAKVTATTQPDEALRKDEAMAYANKKLDSLKAGKLSARASKSDGKVSGVVMTEARRLAKTIVKAQIKAAGQKISDYSAKAITEAANLYLGDHQELIAQAEQSIAQAKALSEVAAVNVAAIPVDQDKVAKREKANAEKRAATSAKNAGKPGAQAPAIATRGGKTPPRPVPTRPQPGASA